jgi:hypothetical protein
VSALGAEGLDVRAEASPMRKPFKISRLINACSVVVPSPAATSSDPISLRSSAVACDS